MLPDSMKHGFDELASNFAEHTHLTKLFFVSSLSMFLFCNQSIHQHFTASYESHWRLAHRIGNTVVDEFAGPHDHELGETHDFGS